MVYHRLDRTGIKEGYQKIGLILSSDIFSQISVEDVMNNVDGMVFGYFDNIDEAKKWIQK